MQKKVIELSFEFSWKYCEYRLRLVLYNMFESQADWFYFSKLLITLLVMRRRTNEHLFETLVSILTVKIFFLLFSDLDDENGALLLKTNAKNAVNALKWMVKQRYRQISIAVRNQMNKFVQFVDIWVDEWMFYARICVYACVKRETHEVDQTHAEKNTYTYIVLALHAYFKETRTESNDKIDVNCICLTFFFAMLKNKSYITCSSDLPIRSFVLLLYFFHGILKDIHQNTQNSVL